MHPIHYEEYLQLPQSLESETALRLYEEIAAEIGADETALEVTRRVKDGKEFLFILNFTGADQPVPESLRGETDRLTGEKLPEIFPPFGAALVVREA